MSQKLKNYSVEEHLPLSSHEMDPEDNTIPSNCCSRWKYELFDKNCGCFDVFELGSGTKRPLDVEKCFAPSRKYYATELARLFMSTFTIVMYFITMWQDWYDGRRSMFLAYLTNWTFTFTIIYQLLVLLISCRRSIIQARDSSTELGYMVKIIWLLYSLVLPMNILVVAMYWILEYPTKKGFTIEFHTVFSHGISCLFVVMDGFFISTIPLRMKQVLFTLIYAVVYITWTLIHGLIIKNGDGINKGRPLYNLVDWNNKPVKTIIVVSIILSIGTPILFTIVWTLSLWNHGCKFDGNHRPTLPPKKPMNSNTSISDQLYGSVDV